MDKVPYNRNAKSLTKVKPTKLAKVSPYSLGSSVKLQPIMSIKSKKKLNFSASLEVKPITEELLATARGNLQHLFTSNHIPNSLFALYEEIINSLDSRTAYTFAVKEAQSIENNSSILKSCLISIRSWEDSLNTIKEMCWYLRENTNWVGIKEVVKQTAETLAAHSLIAIHMAETVRTWKGYMKNSSKDPDRTVKFKLHEQDIIEELRSSCDFLLESTIANLFPVAKSDPFLLAISKEIPSGKISLSKKINQTVITIEKGKAYLLVKSDVMAQLKKMNFLIGKEENSSSPNAAKSPKNEPLPVVIEKKAKKPSREMENFCKLYVEKLIKDTQAKLLKEIISDTTTELYSQSIHTKMLNIINEITIEIAKQTLQEFQDQHSSDNAKRLMISNLVENIVRNLIESEITKLNLENFCEEIIETIIEEKSKSVSNPEVKRRLTLIFKNLESDKLSDLVFNEILDEFINDGWLETLVLSNIGINRRKTQIGTLIINNVKAEETEDNVLEMFTPGVHSPNEVNSDLESESSPDEADVSVSPSPIRRFSSEINTLKKCRLEQIKNNGQKIQEILSQYFEMLPKEFSTFCLDFEKIFTIAENYCDTKFFWVLIEGNNSGLLVYSLNRKGIIIHHLSCLNFALYPELVKTFPSLIDFESDIIIQFTNLSNLPPVAAKALKQKNFLEISEKTMQNVVEFGVKGKKPQDLHSVIISVANVIELSNDAELDNKTDLSMIEAGNRHGIISNIMNIFEAKETELNTFEETTIRLQEDMNELIEIIKSLDYKQYPLFHIFKNLSKAETQKILSENNLKLSLQSTSPLFLSLLSLNLDLISCSFASHKSETTNYKYLHFKSSQMQVMSGNEGTFMFTIPTSQKDLSMFFLKSTDLKEELEQGLKRGKTDLFYNIDNLIKTLIPTDSLPLEFWVPCFRKELERKINWAKGFQIKENSSIVAECNESITVEVSYNGNSQNNVSSKKKAFFADSFVFGIYHVGVKETLDSPFFMCLVNKNNWISW